MRRNGWKPVALLGVIGLVLGLAALPADALYARVDLEKVPIERLVKNLQEIADKDPKDAKVRFNLARVHAMAYALKSDTCEVPTGKPEAGAWFGYEPAHVPFKAKPTDDKEKQKAAEEHLKKALAQYEAVVKLDPKNLTAQLGQAWCLDQAGKKEDAIKAYRAVIDEAWKTEKDKKAAGPGWHSVAVEAGGYLTPLLDKEKDKEEMAKIKERADVIAKLPRAITPIAIPLRNGLKVADLEDANARVRFDADGSGLLQTWTWITADAGWLVLDRQGTGKITSALQLFGNVNCWLFWDNGYEALRALDDDDDGQLAGDELKGLAIWHDQNGNGVSEPGEVKPLAEHGIVGLSCRFEVDTKHPDRIAFSPKGVIMKDGKARASYDVILKQR